MAATLVLTAAPLATVQQLTSLLEAHGVSPQGNVAVATSSGLLSPGSLGAGAFDLVLSVAAQAGHHTVQLLGLVAAALKPGARLVVQEPGASEATLSKNLLLSGLAAAGPAPGGGLAATKPAWETGARASIALKRGAAGKSGAAPAAATWKLAVEAGAEEELVDDEELLTEEDKQRPALPPASDDCEVGAAGRKACANCTCGRAAGEAKPVQLTREMLDNPTSGCGSCGLGDAFRCGGCPYRGLPAFQMGKKIELPPDFLAVDL